MQKLIFYAGISDDVSLEGEAFREDLKAFGVNMTLLLVFNLGRCILL